MMACLSIHKLVRSTPKGVLLSSGGKAHSASSSLFRQEERFSPMVFSRILFKPRFDASTLPSCLWVIIKLGGETVKFLRHLITYVKFFLDVLARVTVLGQTRGIFIEWGGQKKTGVKDSFWLEANNEQGNFVVPFQKCILEMGRQEFLELLLGRLMKGRVGCGGSLFKIALEAGCPIQDHSRMDLWLDIMDLML
ncbi:hypothetical protein Tco_1459135 [Tanacetum coccineum]